MKDPAFLFYFQDYAWGTRRMSYDEKGRYVDLLCEQADKGYILPEIFSKIAGNSNLIKEKFIKTRYGFVNRRLQNEILKRKSYCKSRQKNLLGKSHMDTHMKPHMEDENENININKRKVFKPPSIEEVTAYCKERNVNFEPCTFVNFYESKGWMIGKNKMKDWKAAVRTWEKNSGGTDGQRRLQELQRQFDNKKGTDRV